MKLALNRKRNSCQIRSESQNHIGRKHGIYNGSNTKRKMESIMESMLDAKNGIYKGSNTRSKKGIDSGSPMGSKNGIHNLELKGSKACH